MKYFGKLKVNLKDKKVLTAFIMILLGVLLIIGSSIFNNSNTENKTNTEQITVNDYINQTEEKLSNTLSTMLSGKKVSVMITVESGIEYVYASESKTDNDVATDETGSDLTKTQQSGSNENTYKTIKDDNGNEKPLIISEIMPDISGVFVVCEGGENENIKIAIKSAVQTVLNINAENIYVSGKF